MSKTDHSRPLRVKATDLPTSIEERHDHRNGPCDLPPRPTKPLTCLWGSDATTSCYWAASHEFMVSPEAHCNCQAHAKKRDDYALSEAAARRTASRRAIYEAKTDLSEHGLHDDLSDLEMPWQTDKRWAEEYGGFEDEMTRLAALRDLLAHDGDLPATSLVVDVRQVWAYECCEDCDPGYLSHWVVEALHNDGRREAKRFDSDPWVLLVNATPADQMLDPTSDQILEDSLR